MVKIPEINRTKIGVSIKYPFTIYAIIDPILPKQVKIPIDVDLT